jgi:lantibiotic biosynthesis protein
LTGEARGRALQIVDWLADRIRRERAASSGDASLASGSAGLAVFYAELARSGRGGSDDANALIENAVGAMAREPMGASLYSGFPGVALASEFVASTLDPGGDDRAAEIDEALLRALQRQDWARAPYDLIYGLTGIGVYALSRWPRPAASEMLTAVAGHLVDRASRDDDGVFWWTAPDLLLGPRRTRSPGGGVDLGVAHGMAAVIPLLARIGRLQAEPRITALAADAARWLLTHTIESEFGRTVPGFLDDVSDPEPTRSAWCYGDPGVAATLLMAARDTPSPSWNDAATSLALQAARRPEKQTGVHDAGFCHGSAGLGHLFNRMYQLTGEPGLADAARHWLERAMNEVRATEDISARSDAGAVPWNGSGLLEGMAGIGVVLLSAASSHLPTWDAVFMISSTALEEAASGRHV